MLKWNTSSNTINSSYRHKLHKFFTLYQLYLLNLILFYQCYLCKLHVLNTYVFNNLLITLIRIFSILVQLILYAF